MRSFLLELTGVIISSGFSISGKPHHDPLISSPPGVYYYDVLLKRGLLVKAYAVVMVVVVCEGNIVSHISLTSPYM